MKARWWLLDVLWLAALALYILLGVDRVPFHGDEATLVSMSADYHAIVQQHDIESVKYREYPPDPSVQELRLINGTTGKMAMGLAWDLAGFTVKDLNDQWWWGFYDPSGTWNEWTYNTMHGHMPTERLLHAARISSAVLGITGIAAVFLITRLVVLGQPGRWAAWAASLILTTNPALLLNIRRAMMEGSLLAFASLAVLAALLVVRSRRGRARIAAYAALGVAGGLALSSKHTAGVVVAAAFAGVLAAAFIPGPSPSRREGEPAAKHPLRSIERILRGKALHTLAGLIGAVVLVIVTFLALNPAWWSDPLGMPERVLTLRERLLDRQIVGAKLEGLYYERLSERTEGLFRQAFFAEPQFYEVSYWQEYIGDQIESYRTSWLAGRQGGVIWGALLVAAFAFGIAALLEHWREGPALVVLIWFGMVAVSLLILTPFEWQRYYLPLQPPLAVIAGIGGVRIAELGITWARSRRLYGWLA